MKIFKRGFKHELTEDDLTQPLPQHKSSFLGEKATRIWLKEVEKAKRKRRKPRLRKVLIKQFGCELFKKSVWVVINEFGLRLYQPFFLGLLIRYYNEKDTPRRDVYVKKTL